MSQTTLNMETAAFFRPYWIWPAVIAVIDV